MTRATAHAAVRARERFPDEFKTLEHGRLCITLAREVDEAIAAGRMARNVPRWAHRSRLSKRTDAAARKPAARFVWTEDERRLFLVLRQETTLILTVVKGRSAPAAEA